jgi:hypothetical protein
MLHSVIESCNYILDVIAFYFRRKWLYSHIEDTVRNSYKQTWSLYPETIDGTFHNIPLQTEEHGQPTAKPLFIYIANVTHDPRSQRNFVGGGGGESIVWVLNFILIN